MRQRSLCGGGQRGGKKNLEFPAVGDQLKKATPIIQHNRLAQET
jgi:hypothetical protein